MPEGHLGRGAGVKEGGAMSADYPSPGGVGAGEHPGTVSNPGDVPQ